MDHAALERLVERHRNTPPVADTEHEQSSKQADDEIWLRVDRRRRRLADACAIGAVPVAAVALITPSAVADHYFGAALVDRASATTTAIAIGAVLCSLAMLRFRDEVVPGRVRGWFVAAAVGALSVATWAVRRWADGTYDYRRAAADVELTTVAEGDNWIVGPGPGAVFALLALTLALAAITLAPTSTLGRSTDDRVGRLARRDLERPVSLDVVAAVFVVIALFAPAFDFERGTVGSRLLFEMPRSGPVVAVALAALFLALVGPRWVGAGPPSGLVYARGLAAAAGLLATMWSLGSVDAQLHWIAQAVSIVGYAILMASAVRQPGERSTVTETAASSMGDARPDLRSGATAVAAIIAVGLLSAPWRRQIVPSSASGELVSADRGTDLLPFWLWIAVLSFVLVGGALHVSSFGSPGVSRAVQIVGAAATSVAGGVVLVVAIGVIIDGNHVGVFGGDRILWAPVVAAAAAAAIVVATSVSTVRTGMSPRRGRSIVVVVGVAGAVVVGGLAVVSSRSTLPEDVLIVTAPSTNQRTLAELGSSHGSLGPDWELLDHDEAVLVQTFGDDILEIVDGRPHLASPYSVSIARQDVFGDYLVGRSLGVEAVRLGVGAAPVRFSDRFDWMDVTENDGEIWLESKPASSEDDYTLVAPLADAIADATGNDVDRSAFAVVGFGDWPDLTDDTVAIQNDASGTTDLFALTDPRCGLQRDAAASYGHVTDTTLVGTTVVATVRDGENDLRVVRIASDGSQRELDIPRFTPPDRPDDERGPVSGELASIGGVLHVAVDDHLVVIEDLDAIEFELPDMSPADCLDIVAPSALSLIQVTEKSAEAYFPHAGVHDPQSFSYFTGRGDEYELVESIDGATRTLRTVPADSDLIEFGPILLGGETLMVVVGAGPSFGDEFEPGPMWLARVGDDLNEPGPSVEIEDGLIGGLLPFDDQVIVAADSDLYSLRLGRAPQLLVGFDAKAVSLTGSGTGAIFVQLDGGQVVRVDGLSDGGEVTVAPFAGRAEHDTVRTPIDVQVARSDQATSLDLGEPLISFDIATIGDDLLMEIDDYLVLVAADGSAEILGSLADAGLGTLTTGVDGPLWVTTEAIFAIDIDR